MWIEKEALSRVIAPVCEKYRVNLIIGRGYSSYTQIRRAVKRLPEGKKVVILYIGDFDPSGLHIEEKLKERLIDEAGRRDKHLEMEVRRVALTYEQIRRYNLPASRLKKFGQKRQEYFDKYGNDVWEADALNPEVLVETLEQEVRALIDWEIWDTIESEVEYYRELLREGVGHLFDELNTFGNSFTNS